MIKIIILVIILLTGLVIGPEISANKGYILVSVDGYTTYEMTIISAVLIGFVCYFLLLAAEWVIRKLLSLNSTTRNWFSLRKTRKAQKESITGMFALLEGDNKKALKLLGQSASRSESPAVNYIAAAKAAHYQGKYSLRDKYLKCAEKDRKSNQLATGLVLAELQIEDEQFQDGLNTLISLENKYPKNQRVSELYLSSCGALGRWEDYIEFLNKKKKVLALSEVKYAALSFNAYQALFNAISVKDTLTLQTYWEQKVPRWARKEFTYQEALLKAHIKVGNNKLAEQCLLELLNKQCSAPLLAYVDQIKVKDHNVFIALLEKNLDKDIDNALIHQVLGHLEVKVGKALSAVNHLQKSVEAIPNSEDLYLLAYLLQSMQKEDDAIGMFEKASLL